MKRSILILIPSLRSGGAERTLINLLDMIDYSKYRLDLVLVLKHGPYLTQIPSQVSVICLFNSGFIVRILAYLQKRIGIVYFYKNRIAGKLNQTYDVAISFLDSNFTDLLFLHKKIGKRYACVHASYKHNDNYIKFFNDERYREKLKKTRYKSLDGIIFVSYDAMKDFIEVFGEFPNMKVIYNIISFDQIIKKSLEKINWDKNAFTFIAIGSLLPVKGFDRLLRATKLVSDRGYHIRLIIIGSGPESGRLQKIIKALSLSEIVELKGFVMNPYPYLLYSDVFVMSSISEALPTVLCEAMILAKPVIVTNCTGCIEIIGDGEYGLLAEQDDSDLALKMVDYLRNPDYLIEYSKKASERARIFDDQKTLREYYKIFNS